ncbi:hypothetical protein C8R45DRAFT_939655 [Mycena sanguinolenta]|nr:hypothetical protein C8R45DRAFT_939655 [Mycena sanguinolenta]
MLALLPMGEIYVEWSFAKSEKHTTHTTFNTVGDPETKRNCLTLGLEQAGDSRVNIAGRGTLGELNLGTGTQRQVGGLDPRNDPGCQGMPVAASYGNQLSDHYLQTGFGF